MESLTHSYSRVIGGNVFEYALGPIIFRTPDGEEPDVFIQVFGVRFHVHSSVLARQSSWFRASFAKPGKSFGGFKHRYVSAPKRVVNLLDFWKLKKIEGESTPELGDGFWYTNSGLKYDTLDLRIAFDLLLCSMYGRPFYYHSIPILVDLKMQAEKFGALRCCSYSLTGALLCRMNTPNDIYSIRCNALTWLLDGKKLRNSLLFRESLIHVVSLWGLKKEVWTPRLSSRTDVLKIIENAHNRQLELVAAALCQILQLSSTVDGFNPQPPMSFDFADKKMLPAYFRRLYNFNNLGARESDAGAIGLLLKNLLVLDHGGDAPGEGKYESNFLCAEVNEEDLPWDQNELDW